MFKLFSALMIFSFSCQAAANSLVCANVTARVSDATSSADPFFNLELQSPLFKKHYFFEIQKEYFRIRCEQTPKKIYVLLINHFCGGSGCRDNYRIIDVESGDILLEPTLHIKNNTNEAIEIMGKKIEPFTCGEGNNEICLRSNIELG